MLKNYLKIAWKVLQRRKFFTFVSLFGISCTLMVLLVTVSFFDHLISANVPDVNRDRNLYLKGVQLINEERTSFSQSQASIYFAEKCLKALETPEYVSIFTMFSASNAFTNDQKLILDLRYTDAEYWKIFQFEFLEGKPFGQSELDKKDEVAVISETARSNYFGKGISPIGKFIKTNGKEYRVIGVVPDEPISNIHAHGDLYLPYTIASIDFEATDNLLGPFFSIVQAKEKSDLEAIQEEYQQKLAGFDLKSVHPEFEVLESHLDSYLGSFTRSMFNREDSDSSAIFLTIIGIFMFLFMLLPAINLVNLNITRIMERASEIGVRKAFGASNLHLIAQFLVENLAVTFLGGIIGILLTQVVLSMLNNSQVMPHANLTINYNVLSIGFIICLFFGLMSGVYPAFRMAKLQAAAALKGVDK